MRKILSILLMMGGLGCLIYGGSGLWMDHIGQEQALDQALDLVAVAPAVASKTGEAPPSIPDETIPVKGDVIGVLHIPRLSQNLPIVEGTDEDELARGVGHYSATALPGGNDQILLSGHRDSVFRHMGELEIGDEFVVKMAYGTYTYKITGTKIVDADDRTVIHSTAPDEILVLSTCYPFGYIGSAPDRYIIYAEPLK